MTCDQVCERVIKKVEQDAANPSSKDREVAALLMNKVLTRPLIVLHLA